MQPYSPFPYYQPAPQPVITEEYIRQNEKRKLRKKSNGLGFYIFAYYATLQAIALVMMIVYQSSGINMYTNHSAEYLLDILASVASALIPGLIYILTSGFSIRKCFGKTMIQPTMLIPIVLMGMGVSMAANFAADIFARNISVFGLENHAGNIETSTYSVFEIILSAVAISIVPAFAEEFAFRGIVMGVLKKYGRAFALVCSSIMFGMMHSNTTQIVFATLLGLIFGYMDLMMDSILPSVILHFCNNFYATLMDELETNGNLDQRTLYTIYFFIVFLFCVGGLVSFIYMAKTHKDIFRLGAAEKSELPYVDTMSYKDKLQAFFTSPGIIVSLITFLSITLINLIPLDL